MRKLFPVILLCLVTTGAKAELKVFAQNVQNYVLSLGEEAWNKKTKAIVGAVKSTNADIYAFCEIESVPTSLPRLCDSINAALGQSGLFAAVSDNINEPDYAKSGFIYRTDKVRPVGTNKAAATGIYAKRMRIQAFEEIVTGELFVLSMNHFKAGSIDGYNEVTRIENANSLLSALNDVTIDPDILIIGDLNCNVGEEEAIQKILDAGYEEQLLRFDPKAYSHCYKADDLIDHVLANATMRTQVVNARMLHTCTWTCTEGLREEDSYSDHDPYMVELNLTGGSSDECIEIDESYLATGGTDYHMEPMTDVNISGGYFWRYQSNYGATCQEKGGEDWLLTPEYNMKNAASVTISFEHTIGYANVADMDKEHTLWVTPNYSSVQESEWTQLTIPKYPSGTNWTYVKTSVDVPTELLGRNTVFAFKNQVPASAAKEPKWEIKNLKVTSSCTVESSVESLDSSLQKKASKLIDRNGNLYIMLPDGTRYDAQGRLLR